MGSRSAGEGCLVIDTNVILVANGDNSHQASSECRRACAHFLEGVRQSGCVIWNQDILREYRKRLTSRKGPTLHPYAPAAVPVLPKVAAADKPASPDNINLRLEMVISIPPWLYSQFDGTRAATD